MVEALERACGRLGYPKAFRVDHGTEIVSRNLDLWAYAHGVTLDFSKQGKPTDSPFTEAFNGRFRSECLSARWFLTLADAAEKLEAWRKGYSEVPLPWSWTRVFWRSARLADTANLPRMSCILINDNFWAKHKDYATGRSLQWCFETNVGRPASSGRIDGWSNF